MGDEGILLDSVFITDSDIRHTFKRHAIDEDARARRYPRRVRDVA